MLFPPPPDPGLDLLQEQFVVKKSSDDRWLLAAEPPGKLWPALKAHWEALGAQTEEHDTAAGLMTVIFNANSAKSQQYMEANGLNKYGKKIKLLASVEQGLKRRSSEIRILKIGSSSVPLGLQEKLLQGLSESLSSKKDSLDSYSLVAQKIGKVSKMAIVNDGTSDPYIRLNVSFERAWIAVGDALTSSKIPVVDLSRTDGIYFVNYSEEKEEGGWLSGLFSNDDKLSDKYNFRVELVKKGEDIHILSKPSGEAKQQDRIRLLNQILDHMS